MSQSSSHSPHSSRQSSPQSLQQSPEDRISALLGRRADAGWLPADEDEALDELLPGSRPVPTRLIIAIVVILTLVGIGAFIVYHRMRAGDGGQAGTVTQVVGAPASGVQTSGTSGAGAGTEAGAGTGKSAEAGPGAVAGAQAGEVTVDVVGAVHTPKVITLPAGSRVADALSAAGGPTKKADTAAVNQARVLVDGEQIVVPERGSGTGAGSGRHTGDGSGSRSDGSGGESGSRAGGDAAGKSSQPVNLNTASAEEFQSLPGVGPVTAAAIVSHREEHGPFASVDALTDVSGIGPATLERLRPLVTV